jgi:uncharacterized protein
METATILSGGLHLSANVFWPRAEEHPAPWPGVVIVHGFGGSNESHTEFGEFLAQRGFAAVAPNLRGHVGSEGELDADVLDDVGAALAFLEADTRVDARRLALRGSSMGGNMVIHAALRYPRVHAVVAICPAPEWLMLPWMEAGRAEVEAQSRGRSVRLNVPGFAAYLGRHDLRQAAPRLSPRPVFYVQAKSDELVPRSSTEELYALSLEPKRLLLVEGGDHNFAQHDPMVHAEVAAWLQQWLLDGADGRA